MLHKVEQEEAGRQVFFPARIEEKTSQIINDDIYLSFYLSLILWTDYQTEAFYKEIMNGEMRENYTLEANRDLYVCRKIIEIPEILFCTVKLMCY
jgi:hypothetical protein